MTYQDVELNAYIKSEWNNDRSWLSAGPSTRRHRTRIEYGAVMQYKLNNLLRGLLRAVLPEPCC